MHDGPEEGEGDEENVQEGSGQGVGRCLAGGAPPVEPRGWNAGTSRGRSVRRPRGRAAGQVRMFPDMSVLLKMLLTLVLTKLK